MKELFEQWAKDKDINLLKWISGEYLNTTTKKAYEAFVAGRESLNSEINARQLREHQGLIFEEYKFDREEAN